MSDERDQSEFNMAVSYLERLNRLFYSCDFASMNLDVYNWYHSIMVLFRELSTEMKDSEIVEWEANAEKINNKVMLNVKRMQSRPREGIDPALYKSLHKFEMFLRGICKQAGLQNAMKQDANNVLR
jgi:hypothetical protein